MMKNLAIQSSEAATTTTIIRWNHDYSCIKYNRLQAWLSRIAALVVFLGVTLSTSSGASAVATGLDPDTRDFAYGYWKGNKSEAEARKRAIGFCLVVGCKNARVIASTSRTGYGAIAAFWREGKTRYAVSLGAPTQHRAVSDAIRDARLKGARSAWVVQVWNDG